MCSVCGKAAGFRIAAIGSIWVNEPASIVNPVGVFIHAFAITTKTPEAAPLTATSTPASRCMRGGTRSQP